MLPIAAIVYQRPFDIDTLLAEVCEKLRGSSLRLGGLIQIARKGTENCLTDVKVVDLSTQKTFNIWESRGQCAHGCRLREAGLIEASMVIDQAIDSRVDLLVINRFGLAESFGRGLLQYYSTAVENGVPILTCVREPYVDAWNQFHGGLAIILKANFDDIVGWVKRIYKYYGQVELKDNQSSLGLSVY